jgi:nucleotidyltransferase substrate binding protein (TIGR01987 family)
MNDKPRWQYRFDNFKRAYLLLHESIELKQQRVLSQLEKEGVIQRFEYSIALAWKTMKDYLEYQNLVLDELTPRYVIKEAFASKLIVNAEDWLDALDTRNKMSHTYNLKQFESAIGKIEQNYLPCLCALYEKLSAVLVGQK